MKWLLFLPLVLNGYQWVCLFTDSTLVLIETLRNHGYETKKLLTSGGSYLLKFQVDNSNFFSDPSLYIKKG